MPVLNIRERYARERGAANGSDIAAGSVTLGAELEDGSTIYGQDEISHPSATGHAHGGVVDKCVTSAGRMAHEADRLVADEKQAPQHCLRGFAGWVARASRLMDGPNASVCPRQVFYVTDVGTEVCPRAHSYVLEDIRCVQPSRLALSAASSAAPLRARQVVVYGIGSLFTSIIPCLVPRGVGDAIASKRGGALYSSCWGRPRACSTRPSHRQEGPGPERVPRPRNYRVHVTGVCERRDGRAQLTRGAQAACERVHYARDCAA